MLQNFYNILYHILYLDLNYLILRYFVYFLNNIQPMMLLLLVEVDAVVVGPGHFAFPGSSHGVVAAPVK